MGSSNIAWKVRLLDAGRATPAAEPVSAVFLIAIRDELILAVRNERGWDIPGGHVEHGESPVSALTRETLEEAGATFSWAEPFALVSVSERHDVMLFYTTSAFDLSVFTPNGDALERALMPLDHFMSRYCGPLDVLRRLVDGARNWLSHV